MTTRSRLVAGGATALLCALVLRCGDGVAPPPLESEERPGRVPDPIPSAEVSALASAKCAYLERCDPDALFLFADASRAACEEYLACDAARRRATFVDSPAELAACVESLNTRPCPDALLQPTERFSYGTLAWGAVCGEPTLEERLGPPPDAPSVGETCIYGQDEHTVCAPGSHCVTEALLVIGRYQCGTCEARVAVGEPCGAGALCVEDARCLDGRCRQIRETGESCELDRECRFSRCIDSVCAPSAYTATPYRDAIDRPCGRDGGASENPFAGNGTCGSQAALFCDDGTCRSLPAEGERCAMTAGHPPYELGHRCIGGICRALGCSIDIGEPCSGGCDGGDCVDGVCVPAGNAGDPCESSCGNGLACIEGRCRAARENGRRCDFDRDCASGFCERDLREACADGFLLCDIPECGECGACMDPPTVARCP